MERSLTIYLADPAAAAHPFDVRTIPVLSTEQELVDRRKKDVFVDEVASAPASATAGKGGVAGPLAGGAAGSDDQELEQRAQALGKVPELAHLGTLLVSSKAIALTETDVRARSRMQEAALNAAPLTATCTRTSNREAGAGGRNRQTEYSVSLIKHVFPEHVVLQFACRNTLTDQVLENVTVQLAGDAEELELEHAVPVPLLKYDVVQSTYSVYRKPQGAYPTGACSAAWSHAHVFFCPGGAWEGSASNLTLGGAPIAWCCEQRAVGAASRAQRPLRPRSSL